jgi:hypothetical protein
MNVTLTMIVNQIINAIYLIIVLKKHVMKIFYVSQDISALQVHVNLRNVIQTVIAQVMKHVIQAFILVGHFNHMFLN